MDKQKLKADDFSYITPFGGQVVPGPEFLKKTGFDPEKCEIVANEGTLSVRQEGRISWGLSPEYWRRV